jgi:hypothetical protein
MSKSYAQVTGYALDDFGTRPGQVKSISWADMDDDDLNLLKIEPETKDDRPSRKTDTLNGTYGARAREILGLTETQWALMDVSDATPDGRLVLVGYKRDVNPPFELQELRGVVLDVEAGVKVCPGSEFTEVIRLPSASLPLVEKEGQKTIRVHSEVLDEDIDFDVETDPTVRNRIYSQGANLKVFLHGGRVYVIMNRNLDPSGSIRNENWQRKWDNDADFRAKNKDLGRNHMAAKSKWAHVTFTDDFERILGFDPKLFYPEGCLYSPYTYSFLLSVPRLQTSSRLVFPKGGYLTFIRQEGTWRKLWKHSPSVCPFKENPEDADETSTFFMGTPDQGVNVNSFFHEVKGDDYHPSPAFGNTKLNPFITFPQTNLSVDEASRILRHGLTKNETDLGEGERNFYGESIILTKRITRKEVALDGSETTKHYFYSVQLQSPAYAWRSDFFSRGNYDGDMFKLYVDAISVYSTATQRTTLRNLKTYYPLLDFASFTGEKDASKVLKALFASVMAGRTLFPGEVVASLPSEKVTDEPYTMVAEVVTPYFLAMLNPMRQVEVVQYYSRYSKQLNLLRNYVINNPEKKVGERELGDFIQLCVKTAKSQRPNYQTEAGRAGYLAIITRLFERKGVHTKLALLKQSTLKYGPDKMAEILQITWVGPEKIDVSTMKFDREPKKHREVKERDYKRNANPVRKPGATRDLTLRKKKK